MTSQINCDPPEHQTGYIPRPRVLWLSKGLNRGGAEVLLLALAKETALRDFDIHVATVVNDDVELADSFTASDVPVHNLRARHSLDPTWPLRLLNLMRRGQFDIVHSHSPLPAAVVRLIRGRSRSPILVSTEHNVPDAYRPATRFVNRFTAQWDDARMAVSQAVAEADSSSEPLPVVYHGITPPRRESVTDEEVDAMRSECGFSPADRVILTIANLRPEKNLHLLLDAYRRMIGRVPCAKLVIIGDGREREALERHARNLPSSHRPVFLGKRPSAWRYLALADVFALSSDQEGLPVSVMEAMVMGVPTVATRVGGLSEIVKDSQDGFLVPPFDDFEFADRLGRVLGNTELRARMSRAAVIKGLQFSSAAAAQSYATLYRKLLAS